jgi:ElaB/YqjD/DUF883 family membrane-anchored ribosome-binding protein
MHRGAIAKAGIRARSIVLAGLIVFASFGAAGQASVGNQPIPPAENQPAPPPEKEPGFFETLGRWFDKSASNLESGLKNMKSSLDELNAQSAKAAREAAAAARETSESLLKLPNTRMVEGRERCNAAPNGSPDCRTAAEAICRAKGFASGKSLDTQSARKCPARIWLSGRMPAPDECPLETFVTRAVCQ